MMHTFKLSALSMCKDQRNDKCITQDGKLKWGHRGNVFLVVCPSFASATRSMQRQVSQYGDYRRTGRAHPAA